MTVFFFFADKKLKMIVSYLVLFITVALWDISCAVKRWGYIYLSGWRRIWAPGPVEISGLAPNSGPRRSNRSCESGRHLNDFVVEYRHHLGPRRGWMTLSAKHTELIILCLRAKKLIYYVINYAKMVILWVNFRVQSLPSCNPVLEPTWPRNPSWPRILPGPRIQSGIELFIWFWFRIFLFSLEEMS